MTGNLAALKEYNGLSISVEYFDAALVKLRTQFLDVALDAVLQPASKTARDTVIAQQAAADAALAESTAKDQLHEYSPDKKRPQIEEGDIDQPKAPERPEPEHLVDVQKSRSNGLSNFARILLRKDHAVVLALLVVIVPTAYGLSILVENQKLQRIAQAWETVNQAAFDESRKGPALEYLNSQEVDLMNIDLSTERNQDGSYLREVALPGANLVQANLSRANLYLANLSRADLRRGDLSEAYLQGADLSWANLVEANLSRADLKYVDLSWANLVEANLSRADLKYVDLSVADLQHANLRDADLSTATILSNADLSGANLQGADLSGANFYKTNLSGANLQGANLSEAANLFQKQLEYACGDNKTQLPSGITIKACP